MQSGQLHHGVNIDSMVLPDRFIDQASPAEMYSDAGMSEGHVIDRCTKLLHKGLSIQAVSYTHLTLPTNREV